MNSRFIEITDTGGNPFFINVAHVISLTDYTHSRFIVLSASGTSTGIYTNLSYNELKALLQS